MSARVSGEAITVTALIIITQPAEARLHMWERKREGEKNKMKKLYMLRIQIPVKRASRPDNVRECMKKKGATCLSQQVNGGRRKTERIFTNIRRN